MPSSRRAGGAAAEGDVDNLGLELPGDSQSLYEVALDVREQTWRKKVVPVLIVAVITLWAVWAGKRSASAFFGLPSRAPQLPQYGGGAQQSNSSVSTFALQALSEAAIKKWEHEQLAKQLAEQEKRWKEAFTPQLQALETRLQQEISKKAKEVEGKVVGLQHNLTGLEAKVVVAEQTSETREAAMTTLQKDLQQASSQLKKVEAEASSLSKELAKRASEQLQQASERGDAAAALSSEALSQLEALQTQFDEITIKLGRVEGEAEELSRELELLQSKRLEAAAACATAQAGVGDGGAVAAEEDVLERVVVPEIKRALEQEHKAQAELLHRLETAQQEAERTRSQLEEEKKRFQAKAEALLQEAQTARQTAEAAAAAGGGGQRQQEGGKCPGPEEYEKRVTQEVERQLGLLAADEVAMVDHAALRLGSRVVRSLTSPSYSPQGTVVPTDWLHFLGFEHQVAPKEEVISAKTKRPGDCWPMEGRSGNVTIRLHSPILPKAVTVQHVHHSISTHKGTAPKLFRVWGRALPDSAPLLLGTFTYVDGQDKTTQTFALSPPPSVSSEPLQLITFEVLSNYGHHAYTCLYRLRVHGDLVTPEPR